MSTPVPVLLYHSISDTATSGFRRWTVSPLQFAEQMRHLSSSGFSTLTAAEFASSLRREATLPPRPVVVTFDDGYGDFATQAAPVMRRHGISSTLFITAGYIGGSSQWLIREKETDRRMLTWGQLKELSDDSIELGGHGYSHRQLDTLPLAEALQDVERGKRLIEKQTGGAVVSFAYPFGYASPALRRAILELGFTSAYGVGDAMSSPDDQVTSVSRLIVDADTTLDRFETMLSGAGVAPHGQSYSWRQAAWRGWRRGRLALRVDRPHVPQ